MHKQSNLFDFLTLTNAVHRLYLEIHTTHIPKIVITLFLIKVREEKRVVMVHTMYGLKKIISNRLAIKKLLKNLYHSNLYTAPFKEHSSLLQKELSPPQYILDAGYVAC